MTSESGGPQGITDDRLAEARDSVLADGETVVAQAEGDQGQGIVLTNSRILIVKVGVTATGVANGRLIGNFPLQEVTAVHLRRGPLGAVIQLCAAQSSASPGPGAPDNVIVFTGQPRVKKCEAMAASIEKVIPKAAADGTARELTENNLAVESTEQESAQKPSEEIDEDSDSCEFRPNPNLPSPARADNSAARKMLVLLGLLLAALLVGTAVTAPLRTPDKTRSVEVDVGQLTNNPSVAQKQLAVVADFESRLTGILGELAPSLSALESGLRSSNRAAVASALRGNAADRAWHRAPCPWARQRRGMSQSRLPAGVLRVSSA